MDVGGVGAFDLELVCAVEGTATNAAIQLITGMQVQTEDGWVSCSPSFAPISGTGQQIVRVSVGSGLLQFLRWNVSSLGGATALTFFIRGMVRDTLGATVPRSGCGVCRRWVRVGSDDHRAEREGR